MQESKSKKKPLNSNKRWSADEDDLLVQMINQGKTTKQICRVLKRTGPSVWGRKCSHDIQGRIKRGAPVYKRPAKKSPAQLIAEYAKEQGIKATIIILED